METVFIYESKAKTVTLRGQSAPKRDLALFIELVNAERLFEHELPELFSINDFSLDLSEYTIPKYDKLRRERHEAASVKLSARTRAYLGPPSDVSNFSENYELLRSAGQALVAITKLREGLRGKELMILDSRHGKKFPFEVRANLVIDKDGLLSISDNPVLRILSAVPVDRIRACAICKSIFWAPRVNSECCSLQCRKAYNQRNSREARRKLLKNKILGSRKGVPRE